MTFFTINPFTAEPLQEYTYFSDAAVERALAQSQSAALELMKRSADDRAGFLLAIAHELTQRRAAAAEMITREMGKPISQSLAEIDKCVTCLEYYGEAKAFLEPEVVSLTNKRGYSVLRPLGVLLAVMPWNFPFWQVIRVLAPNILLGNTVVLKHASNTTGCALLLEEIVSNASDRVKFPVGALRTVILAGREVGRLISDSRIKAVTLTGSAEAGRSVATLAGQHLKKSVLELGGSDPYIVLRDADVAAAARACVTSRMINSGQSCVAAKRFIVEDAVHDEFVDAFLRGMESLQVGDPMLSSTHVGPLARADLVRDLEAQVQKSCNAGARVVSGDFGGSSMLAGVGAGSGSAASGSDLRAGSGDGGVSDAANAVFDDARAGSGSARIKLGQGYFFAPQVLVDVRKDHAVFQEETFGPVAAIVRARNEADAIMLANKTLFGLGAAIFSSDVERAERIAREQLQAGLVAVNDFVQSDPRLPFGGINESGYGRELGHWGISEFANVKSVVVGG